MNPSKPVACLLALAAALCLVVVPGSSGKEVVIPKYSYTSLPCNAVPPVSWSRGGYCSYRNGNPAILYPSDITKKAENRMCTQTLPAGILDKVNRIFTEGSSPTILTQSNDLYMNITRDNTYFKITYLHADCSNGNSLGYFKYDWATKKIILDKEMGANYRMYPGPLVFYRLETNADKCYSPGYSIEYGPFMEGESIGFYIGDNTYRYINANKQNMNFTGYSHFSIGSLNKKNYDPIHVWVHMRSSINMYLIGIDDNGVNNHRDLDYNDIIVLLELNRANVTVIDPPEYDYDEGKLDVCSTVNYFNSSLWLTHDRHIYTLLLPPLPSDCVNYLNAPSPWEWAKNDSSAMKAYQVAAKSIWLPYVDNQLVFKSTSNSSEQVSLNASGDRGVSTISYYANKSSSDCVWVGCSSLRVLRKLSDAVPVTPSQCRPDKEEIYSSPCRPVESVMVPDTTTLTISGLINKMISVSTLHLLRPRFGNRVMELTFYYDFSGLSNTTIRNSLSPSMSNYLSSNLDSAYGFSRTSIELYVHYRGQKNCKKVGRANRVLDLNGLFSDTLKISDLSSAGNPSKLLEGIVNALDPLDPHIGYKVLVVFTATGWNESDEAAFVEAVRPLGRQVVFVGPPYLANTFKRLASKVPYMGYDTSNWATNWYLSLCGGGTDKTKLVYGYEALRLYPVNATHASWLKFIPTADFSHAAVDLNPTYTVNWNYGNMKDLMNGEDGVIIADIAMAGWGVTMLEIRYNKPPTGRNLTVQCSSSECAINLPTNDSNIGDMLNIQISQLPSRGKLISKRTSTSVELKAGDFLNRFDNNGFPDGAITSTVYYVPSINGRYTFVYVVYDGCEYSPEYVVTVEISRENTQIRADHIILTVGKDVTLANAQPFTAAQSVIDPDPYEPIYVMFERINTSVGSIYDKNKKLISAETKGVTTSDTLYFVPARTSAPGVMEIGALFFLVESTEGRNTSNKSWIYVNRTWSGESPPVIYFENPQINIYKLAQFTIVLECERLSLVDVYVEKIDAGNAIYVGDKLVVEGPVSSPVLLFSSVRIPDDSFMVSLPDPVWKVTDESSMTENTTISGTFYALRQPGNESYQKSESAILHLTWKDAGNKNLEPRVLDVTVPPLTKGRNSSKFDLLGVDDITSPPGSMDFTFSIDRMPKGGELYRSDNNQPLALGSAAKADGTFFYKNKTDGQYRYGSKLSIYYVPMRANNDYPKGDGFTFKYRAFNLYKYSDWKGVSFKINDALISPVSSSQDIYVSEGSGLDHIFPLIMNNGLMPGYLIIGDHNVTALYVGPVIPPDSNTSTVAADGVVLKRGDDSNDVIVIGSKTLEEVAVHFSASLNVYSYKPGQDPVLYTIVKFKACDNYSFGDTKGVCSNDYDMNIYVKHSPHPPVSKSAVLEATRAVALEVNLTAYDIDDYDMGNIVMRLYISSLKEKLYLDSEMKQPIKVPDGQDYVKVKPALLYYVSNSLEDDLQLPHDMFTYDVIDTTDLVSVESTVTIYVSPRGDPPSTSLTEINASQNMSYTFSLTSSKYVTVEQLGSSARANILRLPEGTLLECTDSSCSSNVTIAQVPYQLSSSGSGSRLIYISPLYKWGDAFTSIQYTLTDVVNNQTSAEYSLTINVQHVNKAPMFEVLNSSLGTSGALSLKQTDVHDFVWKLTDVDTLPKDLYVILEIGLSPSANWSLYECLDADCSTVTPFILDGGKDNGLSFRMDPSYIIDDDCKTEQDLYDMNGNLLEKCYAYFKYRLYGDTDMLVTTTIGFGFVGSDQVTYSTERSLVVTHLLVNKPPTIWAPAKITVEKGTKTPFIRDTDPDSATYGKSVTVGDAAARPDCAEILTMSSDTPGNFELPASAAESCMVPPDASSDSSPVILCNGTVNNLNSWLSELRFHTEQTAATLHFSLSDEGCSSDVSDDQVYSAEITTELDLTATAGGSSNSKIVGIAAGSAATVGIALLGAATYFFRQRLTSPPDVYFDIGNESVFTAPQNPLFQSNTREYSSSIYKNA